jgi:hypothetical protein
MALVEQFCSWSAWSMKSTSRARDRMGSASKRGSAIFHIMDRKLDGKSRELSGKTKGKPTENRWAKAARVGILAMSRITWRIRTSGSEMSLASG